MSTIYESILKKMKHFTQRAEEGSEAENMLKVIGSLLEESNLSHENEDMVFNLFKEIRTMSKIVELSEWHQGAWQYLVSLEKKLRISYFTDIVKRCFSEALILYVITHNNKMIELDQTEFDIRDGILNGFNADLEPVTISLLDINFVVKKR